MMKTIRVFTLLAALAAVPASAQTTAGDAQTSISVNIATQLQQREFTTANSLTIFGETATFSAAHSIDKGLLFDVSGARATGFRQLWVSFGFSTFSDTSSAALTTSIPHPVFFNRSLVSTSTVADLDHSEVGIHLAAMWVVPVMDNIEVAVFGGPSFIRTNQDLVQNIQNPTAAQVASPIVVKQSATAAGVNAGVDFRYRVNNTIGAGFLLRYAGGTAKLESASVKVGGTQIGVGLRVYF